MIVKMKKVAFSCDNKRKGKHTGSLTSIWYTHFSSFVSFRLLNVIP